MKMDSPALKDISVMEPLRHVFLPLLVAQFQLLDITLKDF
jgi:hypothetical protein